MLPSKMPKGYFRKVPHEFLGKNTMTHTGAKLDLFHDHEL